MRCEQLAVHAVFESSQVDNSKNRRALCFDRVFERGQLLASAFDVLLAARVIRVAASARPPHLKKLARHVHAHEVARIAVLDELRPQRLR